MKKILIIGGTGFLGYHLAKNALKKNWKVFSLSINKPKKKNPAIIAAIIHISCLALAASLSPTTSRSHGLAQRPCIAIWAL